MSHWRHSDLFQIQTNRNISTNLCKQACSQEYFSENDKIFYRNETFDPEKLILYIWMDWEGYEKNILFYFFFSPHISRHCRSRRTLCFMWNSSSNSRKPVVDLLLPYFIRISGLRKNGLTIYLWRNLMKAIQCHTAIDHTCMSNIHSLFNV